MTINLAATIDDFWIARMRGEFFPLAYFDRLTMDAIVSIRPGFETELCMGLGGLLEGKVTSEQVRAAVEVIQRHSRSSKREPPVTAIGMRASIAVHRTRKALDNGHHR